VAVAEFARIHERSRNGEFSYLNEMTDRESLDSEEGAENHRLYAIAWNIERD
jgi:hypothetical protein